MEARIILICHRPLFRAFIEYLRTLGLRTYPGTGEDKRAFEIVVEESGQRGWH